jgi:CheY-like chemotaxis protein
MKSILVVDDDSSVRELLTIILGDQYTVSDARDGSEALQLIGRKVPDVVLLDMTMPVMDGWTFLKVCRSQPRCAALPVLVLSAEPTASADSQLLGAQECLYKPFDIDVLLAAVARLLA